MYSPLVPEGKEKRGDGGARGAAASECVHCILLVRRERGRGPNVDFAGNNLSMLFLNVVSIWLNLESEAGEMGTARRSPESSAYLYINDRPGSKSSRKIRACTYNSVHVGVTSWDFVVSSTT